MRAVRNSPLFRIALLSLAVLFAHTVRAQTLPIIPVCPPCPGKVAAAQPDSEKKLPLAGKQVIKPSRLAHAHSLFGGSFDLAGAHPASTLSLSRPGQIAIARGTVYIAPQRWPFTLRL
jgi:hypothetical protein